MPERRVDNLTALIKEWIRATRGRWSTRQLDYDLNIESAEDKALRRWVVKQFCDAGELERIPNLEGVYRAVDSGVLEVDWQSADTKLLVSLQWPFELEKYVKIYPKSIVCLAGGKDAGKTGFLYELVLRNMFHPLGMDLFNSETGIAQMKERLYTFDIEIPTPAPFRVFERMDNFADVVDPDRISVIDYLDLGSELYMVGEEINKIFKKLDKGIAIIGLQKPPPTVTFVRGKKKLIYRDLAYGSGFTAKRAILYISLDGGKLKLVHVKTPANPTVNPRNKMWSYRFDNKGRFTDIVEFQEAEGEEE